MAEVDRVRGMFREARLSRGGSYEVMAVLILLAPNRGPCRAGDVARFQAIYEEMQKHHWWLTGVADFPACAILVGQEGSPEAIGQEIEAIYQELHAAGFKKGDPLQTAANLLYLGREKSLVVASRFHALAEAFTSARADLAERVRRAGHPVVPQRPARACRAAGAQEPRGAAGSDPRPDRALAFNLASSIAFVELIRPAEPSPGITDAKAMMDMQALINAQQAAVMAGSMAAITAATSTATHS